MRWAGANACFTTDYRWRRQTSVSVCRKPNWASCRVSAACSPAAYAGRSTAPGEPVAQVKMSVLSTR
ncbi:hypothetical protein KCP73_11660 [Salmonella enterica subsp. enterica]|nr:hypothetical protein KCP73_11660 [Salmonella enterica subsp. enterica]